MPDYPHHSVVQAYFDSYARHFGVIRHIRFRHTVNRAALASDGSWRVEFTDAEGRERGETYSHLMVANGHHWHPRWPTYPGAFSGSFMHSHDFKQADDSWRGKKVLIIGGGNSACDVAVELARLARKVAMSMRSPQWFIPKFMFGVPFDRLSVCNPLLPPRLRELRKAGIDIGRPPALRKRSSRADVKRSGRSPRPPRQPGASAS